MTNSNEGQIAFIGAYEVREVRMGWLHPKDERGRYIPLLPFGYQTDGERAPADQMMPPPLGDVRIAAYEAITEGTPISPAFADTPEGRLALINWCSKHQPTFGKRMAAPEAWATILFGDAAILTDGSVIGND